MEKAVLYIRVSTEEQVKGGVSLAAQEERLLAYCTLCGLEPVAVIREEGISASKPLAARPAGAELVKMVQQKQVGHVVALKLDRLFRDAVDALTQTKQWDKAGIALHLVDMGGQAMNTASAMGRMMLTMMSAFAELERNLIAERTTQALEHKKEHREVYAPTPYGYNREGDALTPNQVEQAVIIEINKRRGCGHSLRKIADYLNGSGVPTKQGGRWYASTVKYILENDLHKGVA